MGGYGTYLGFRIRFSDDIVRNPIWSIIKNSFEVRAFKYFHLNTCLLWIQEEKAKAKDLHPKLLAGMFFFFALGATGGVTSLLTSDKPIFERYLCNLHGFF